MVKSKNVCHWIKDAVNEVKTTTVRAYFNKSGFLEEDIHDAPVEEDNTDLSNLITFFQTHTGINEPMTTTEFIELDDEIPTTDDVMEGLEERLLQDYEEPSHPERLQEEMVDMTKKKLMWCLLARYVT